MKLLASSARSRGATWLAGGGALFALLAGCGDEEGGSVGSRVDGAPQTATTSQPVPSAAADSAPPEMAPSGDGLAGYGATREAWDAAHEAAPGYPPDSSYLPLVNGRPRYGTVIGGPGERIYSYTLSFPDGTLLDEAKRQVLQEFPPDARFGVEDADEPRCLLADVRSPAVEAVMDGDRPLVGFFSEETADTEDFDPRDVDYAIFTLAAPDESVDLGMC